MCACMRARHAWEARDGAIAAFSGAGTLAGPVISICTCAAESVARWGDNEVDVEVDIEVDNEVDIELTP